LARSRSLLDQFQHADQDSAQELDAVHGLELQCELVQSPLHRIEHLLQPWVSFLIMPLFALANAGVPILGNLRAAVTHPVTLGVALGLFAGKPMGITAAAWLSTRLKLATAPAGVNWEQIVGASWLCGIGFTMSLFIAGLAFGQGALLDLSKIGILAASVLAGTGGALLLRRVRVLQPSQN